jgi:RNA polymerase sigma-70 factor, ECF subfamily
VRTAGSQAPALSDHAEKVVDGIVVQEALELLSAQHPQVVTALYFQDRSIAEVAETVGVPPGTIESRCYFALHRLREIVPSSTFG